MAPVPQRKGLAKVQVGLQVLRAGRGVCMSESLQQAKAGQDSQRLRLLLSEKQIQYHFQI